MANDPGTPRIVLNRQMLDDLALVLKFQGRLANLDECYHDLSAATTARDQSDIVAAQLECDSYEARELIYVIFRLITLRRNLELSAATFVQALAHNLAEKAPTEWKDQYLGAWYEVIDEISPILEETSPISVYQKAMGLAYSHQNVLHDARIITDSRPVFDDAGEEIVASVITHVLRIEFTSTEGDFHNFQYFAMDASDLANLRSLCTRAERKARVLKDALQKQSWNVAILGESPDA